MDCLPSARADLGVRRVVTNNRPMATKASHFAMLTTFDLRPNRILEQDSEFNLSPTDACGSPPLRSGNECVAGIALGDLGRKFRFEL